MMIRNTINGVFSLILLWSFHSVLGKSCKKESACSCNTGSGVIDLKPLGRTDGTAAYADVIDPLDSTQAYAWNPCFPFSLDACNNVAACHEAASGPITQYIPIGTQDSVEFQYSGDQLTLVYTAAVQNPNQKAVVKLVCDKSANGDFKSLGRDTSDQNIFNFELTSKYACETGGLSVGSILCIALVSVLVIYLIFGSLIQVFVRKESGVRAVPNHDFWVVVPGFIKDGVLFIVTRGKRSEYNKV